LGFQTPADRLQARCCTDRLNAHPNPQYQTSLDVSGTSGNCCQRRTSGYTPITECSAALPGRRLHCGAQAPVYNNLLRGDVRRGIRCQENSGSGEVARFSPPAKRDSVIYSRDKCLIR
jgi:hypothetical protein